MFFAAEGTQSLPTQTALEVMNMLTELKNEDVDSSLDSVDDRMTEKNGACGICCRLIPMCFTGAFKGFGRQKPACPSIDGNFGYRSP
jgi:hypothetical protein